MACVCGIGACSVRGSCSTVTINKQFNTDKNRIYDINLDSICTQLISKSGWTLEKTNKVSFEYREFLQQFIGKDPKNIKGYPPSQDIDDFWHQHILDTRKYAIDCEYLFGFMLHHDPSTLAA